MTVHKSQHAVMKHDTQIMTAENDDRNMTAMMTANMTVR